MKPWYGHLPVTSIALLSILNRAATDDGDFSRDERVLFTACEFWAAVSATELRAHLGCQPVGRLRAAGLALSSVGAGGLAQAIFSGADELSRMDSQENYDEYIGRLERQLRISGDTVDVLIGLMAQRCISAAKLTGHASGSPCI